MGSRDSDMETPDARLKRMTMRSWRRGTKEMDLVLGPFADANLVNLSEAQLLIYDRLLNENDQDLLPMVLGQSVPPAEFTDLIAKIGAFARSRLLDR